MSSGYYPDGAEFNPRAPYNEHEPDYSSYEDEAKDRIWSDEIACFSEEFTEYLRDTFEDVCDYEDDDLKDWYDDLEESSREEIEDAYTASRLSDVTDEIIQEEADASASAYEDYCERKYEEMRERDYYERYEKANCL